jgi:hypothetical protein
MREKLTTIRMWDKKMDPNCQNCQPTGGNGVGRFSLVWQNWVAPLALSTWDLVSATQPKQIISDRFGHLNGSARWRCPEHYTNRTREHVKPLEFFTRIFSLVAFPAGCCKPHVAARSKAPSLVYYLSYAAQLFHPGAWWGVLTFRLTVYIV